MPSFLPAPCFLTGFCFLPAFLSIFEGLVFGFSLFSTVALPLPFQMTSPSTDSSYRWRPLSTDTSAVRLRILRRPVIERLRRLPLLLIRTKRASLSSQAGGIMADTSRCPLLSVTLQSTLPVRNLSMPYLPSFLTIASPSAKRPASSSCAGRSMLPFSK